MKLMRGLLIFFCLQFIGAQPVGSTPLSADKLFKNPDYRMVKLSPDGRYVSAVYYGKKDPYIDLIDIKKSKLVSSLSLARSRDLVSYEWLNEKQIYLDYSRSYRDKNHSKLVNISNGKMQIVFLKSDGYLVSALPGNPEQVLFAKRRRVISNYFDLYIINIDSLLANEFSNAYQVKHNDKRVGLYAYGARNNVVFTASNEKDT